MLLKTSNMHFNNLRPNIIVDFGKDYTSIEARILILNMNNRSGWSEMVDLVEDSVWFDSYSI